MRITISNPSDNGGVPQSKTANAGTSLSSFLNCHAAGLVLTGARRTADVYLNGSVTTDLTQTLREGDSIMVSPRKLAGAGDDDAETTEAPAPTQVESAAAATEAPTDAAPTEENPPAAESSD